MGLRRKANEPPLGDSAAELADGERVPYAASELKRIPRIKLRWVVVAIFGLIGVAFFKGQQTIDITKSCTTPAFALEDSALQKHNLVKFSMTGPDGVYVLGFNLKSIVVKADGAFQLVPKDGQAAGTFQLGGKQQLVDKCIGHGYFAVNVEPGTHEIEMFRFPEKGTAATLEPLTSRSVEIGAEKKR